MGQEYDTLTPDKLVGEVIHGYKIVQRIGNSLVFLGFKQGAPDRQVAIKFFYPDPYAENRESILQRLRAILQLEHENIVKVLDVGEEVTFIYAVMEYIPGENLYDLMQRNPRLHWAAGAELAKDIVKGLVAAHAQKILHRSLHPDRVLLGKEGKIKINFCNEGEITPSKEIVYYVAPELFLGKELEECSDIYALGAIIYNIVTGNPPLAGKEPKEVAMKHRQLCPVLPSYGVSDIPHPLSLILSRSLDVDPKERYRHCFELEAAFNNFLRNDIGSYKLGSYKELFRRVEVSEVIKQFTKEVEKVQRQKVQGDPKDDIKAVATKQPEPQAANAQEVPPKTVTNVTQPEKASSWWERTSKTLGPSWGKMIGWGLLSVAVNIGLAILILLGKIPLK